MQQLKSWRWMTNGSSQNNGFIFLSNTVEFIPLISSNETPFFSFRNDIENTLRFDGTKRMLTHLLLPCLLASFL